MIIVFGPVMWLMIGLGYLFAYTLWGVMIAVTWTLTMIIRGLIVTGMWCVAVAWPALMTYLERVREHR